MFLVVHAALSGMPAERVDATADNTQLWDTCRLVRLTWALFTETTQKQVRREQYTMVPDGPGSFEISTKASKIHGITMEVAKETGIPVSIALDQFMMDVHDVSRVVLHNEQLVGNVILSELHRLHWAAQAEAWKSKEKVCTMHLSRQRGPLSVLHTRLFGPSEGAWGAGEKDVAACARCYRFLRAPANPPSPAPATATPAAPVPVTQEQEQQPGEHILVRMERRRREKRQRESQCQCCGADDERMKCHGSTLTCMAAKCDWCFCIFTK